MDVNIETQLDVAPTLYDLLGVARNAGAAEIRSAYKREALCTHPDKGGSKEAFQHVAHAFEILSSEQTRNLYDRHLENKYNPPEISKTPEGPSPSTAKRQRKADLQANSFERDARHNKPNPSQFLGRPGTKRERALRRLQHAIAALEPEHRTAAIKGMPQNVRVLLLKFMETQNACSSPGFPHVVASRHIVDSSVALAELSNESESDCESSCSGFSHSAQDVLASMLAVEDDDYDQCLESSPQDRAFNPSSPGTDVGNCRTSSTTNSSSKSGLRGIFKLSDGKYRAQSYVYNLRMVTNCTPNLESAIDMHTVLVLAKQLVLQSARCTALLGPSIRFALSRACSQCNMHLDDFGMLFRVDLYAKELIGRVQVFGRYSADLEQVLQQRETLLAAKEKGWKFFRAAWIQLLQQPSAITGGSASAKCRTAEEAARVADAARENMFAAIQERALRNAQTEVKRAALLVERLLEREANVEARRRIRQFLVARRRAREQAQRERERQLRDDARRLRKLREERYRWMKDPARTLEEIFQGPPQ